MSREDDLKRLRMAKIPKPKKPYKGLAKVSPKTAAKRAAEAEERGDNDTELVKWYKNRMKQMTGRCNETGLKTETKIYQFAIMSICHLLHKRQNMCPSVKIHPLNWIELAPDIHTMYDAASWEEREMMGCWETIRDRLIMVYPDLAIDERRHFPQSVLTYMEKNKAF